jgi:sugar/nucleoside kinase (ribokinase family)
VIVVVGAPLWEAGDPGAAGGLAVAIARSAAAAGSALQIVGKVGDDPEGDQLLIDLTRAGVGHVAVLRDPSARTPMLAAAADEDDNADVPATDPPDGLPLDAGDLELALRYLTDFAVLVVADPVAADALRVAIDSAAFAGAHLVIVLEPGRPEPDAPPGATILEAPAEAEAAGFATLLGDYAAAIDRGIAPGDAFREAAAEVGLER